MDIAFGLNIGRNELYNIVLFVPENDKCNSCFRNNFLSWKNSWISITFSWSNLLGLVCFIFDICNAKFWVWIRVSFDHSVVVKCMPSAMHVGVIFRWMKSDLMINTARQLRKKNHQLLFTVSCYCRLLLRDMSLFQHLKFQREVFNTREQSLALDCLTIF